MGRYLAPPPAPRAVYDGQALERRYRWLGRYLLATDPGSSAGMTSERIRGRRDALDRTSKPVATKLAELETWLAAEGLLPAAANFADRYCPPPPEPRAARRRPARSRRR